MKKLFTVTTAIFTLLIGATALNAQNRGESRSRQNTARSKPAPLHGGQYRRVHRYKTVKIVRKRNARYRNTYMHTVFPNGRHRVRLIESLRIRHRHNTRSFYRTETEYRGRRAYRVTYKVTRRPNGRVTKKVVRRVRI